MAFYLTWPPYLALQYAWAGGRSFTNYGLILTAATMVPLQGYVGFGAELDWLYVFPSHTLLAFSSLEVSGMRWCMLDQGCCRKGGTRRHHALNKQQTPLNPVMDDGAICR